MPKASISLTPFIIWVPLFYLVLLSFPLPGPLVLLSPTQFCPSDKHFLTFPPLSSRSVFLTCTHWLISDWSKCMSHGSWLVDSSTYACTVGSFMIGRSVYLYLPRWTHTERRAEHIPTNPASHIFQSHLPLSYFLSYSGGCGGAELQRACGGADLTVRAAARNCSVRVTAWIYECR